MAMKEKKRKQLKDRIPDRIKNTGVLKIAIPILVGVAVITTAFSLMSRNPHTETTVGVSYIKKMETMDISPIKQKISNNHKEEKRQLLLEGKLSVWEQFEDFAIIGDSRAVGFYYFEFLDCERVLAHGGATIRDIKNTYWDQLIELNPKNVFLCFGLNDIGIGYWSSPEEYTAEYEQIIGEIRAALPGVQICVSSILIARDPAFEMGPSWRKIPEYNVAVEAMCERIGCGYADNTKISEEHPDLWDQDGVHVKNEFYPYWATNLIAEVEDEA